MSSDIAIRAAGLRKAYRIYPAPADRLRQSVYPRIKRLLRRLLPPLGRRLRDRDYFTDFWALKDISFEIARGETVGIVGRNGSGKSTLLQLVCGTLSPSAGEVQVNGRVAALLELGSGFNPEYTGRENIILNANVLGLSREETLARMDSILDFAEIGDFIDQPTKTYSSGMAMRLAFAVIAHVDADVLIIDEALAVGDAMFQQKCFRWLRDFQARGTLLYCGHDTGAILGLCTRAIWLNKGDTLLIGPAREVVEAYTAFTQTGRLSAPAAAPAAEAGAAPAAPVSMPAEAQAQARLSMEGERESYGSGLAEITRVSLGWDDPSPRNWLEGGEEVELRLEVTARADLHQLVAGFTIKDRLGQPVLGDNTVDLNQSMDLRAGETAELVFRFTMPHLNSGSYALSPAVASGTQMTHITHHWVHDAIVLEFHAPRDIGAIVAIKSHEKKWLRRPDHR
ncbi:ABC transporter ATP-binding protein [Roseococcus sp. YIM B11640]|uniref:ABC transporter ATP-binding protein n=1 Tax=Roseococcus sp. YIM B11640 TaxID=3133973 RepID=UPI003C7E7317